MTVPYAPYRDFDAELCDKFPRIEYITEFLVTWLRNHFQDPNNLVDETLRRKPWTADPTRGGLGIEDFSVWDPKVASKRPILVVRRRRYQLARQVINDQLLGTSELTGRRDYMNVATGVHSVVACSTLHQEAEILAGEALRELNGFAPAIREEYGFEIFRVDGWADTTKREKEYGEHWASEIDLGLAFQQTWSIIPQAPLLKTIKANNVAE